MNSNEIFLKTLKRIGYQDVDVLDDSNLNLIISEQALRSFFEVFCTLNERNALSTEELKEYSALSPDELTEILKNDDLLLENDIEYENKKEILFLQEHLAHIENRNKSIERQVDLFKKHEENLLEEKEIHQDLLSHAKKRFQTYEMNKIPLSEEEFISSLESILEVAQDLETLILHSDNSTNKLPTSTFFKDLIQQYLDVESKLLQCVNVYFQANFQFQDNEAMSFIAHENSHRQELLKEASFLQNRLKKSMIGKVMAEKELQNIESIIKYFGDNKPHFNYHSSQLRYELEEASKLNEQLTKKENELKAYVYDAVSKHVDTLLTEIDLCVTNETFHKFQYYIEKMSLPMDNLLQQRARLELLTALLNDHKQELQIIKDLVKNVLNQVKEQKLYFEERKVLFESKMVDVAQMKSEQNPEATILSSLYKIFGVSENLEDSNTSKVPITDVLKKANKLFEAKEDCTRKSEEKMKTIELIEYHSNCMESLLNCTGKEYSNWHELQHQLNVDLNHLDIKLTSLEASTSDCQQDLDQKKKILDRKGNVRLARNLYVYALTNNELFKKCIDDIKIALENSANYKS